MKTPHKHAYFIHAYADGEKIQWKNDDGEWLDCSDCIEWWIHREYRIKPEPDPYQHLKEAHARGEQIEGFTSVGRWVPLSNPQFVDPVEHYRIASKKELPPKQPYSQDTWRYGWVKRVHSEAVWAVSEVDPTGIMISQLSKHFSWEDLMLEWECSETLYGTFQPCYR